MLDTWDKVDSTIIQNCWCSTNTSQVSNQNSEENTQEKKTTQLNQRR